MGAMAAEIQLPGMDETSNAETIGLQQQVARLQALLEASRQVHSTVREEEVLEQVLRIVVRELEMAGAAFPGAGLSYGDAPSADASQAEAFAELIRSTIAKGGAWRSCWWRLPTGAR